MASNLTIGQTYEVRFGPPDNPARVTWRPAVYVGTRERRERGAVTITHKFAIDAGYSYTTTEPARDVR